jgi:hypothetical protein
MSRRIVRPTDMKEALIYRLTGLERSLYSISILCKCSYTHASETTELLPMFQDIIRLLLDLGVLRV